MRSNLVSLIDRADFLGAKFIMGDAAAVAAVGETIAEQTGIEVEGALETVFVQKLYQPKILCDAVVVAECDRFAFAGFLKSHVNTTFPMHYSTLSHEKQERRIGKVFCGVSL